MRRGRRAAGGSVSAWRMFSHNAPIKAKAMKARNTPCQSEIAMIPAPSVGATAGIMMKIIMTKLLIRAISRPS